MFDAASFTTRNLKIRKNPATKITELIDYDQFCGIIPKKETEAMINSITVKDLKSWIDERKDFQLIDVREAYEYEICHINGELVPLNTILNYKDQISTDKPVVVQCRSGVRSANAIKVLQSQFGFDNLLNLEGGILAWAKEIDTSMPTY